MTQLLPSQFKDPDLRGAAAALKRAGQRALALSLQSGTPCWVMIDGKMVDLTKQHGISSGQSHHVER
jgi:hypothetical protein